MSDPSTSGRGSSSTGGGSSSVRGGSSGGSSRGTRLPILKDPSGALRVQVVPQRQAAGGLAAKAPKAVAQRPEVGDSGVC